MGRRVAVRVDNPAAVHSAAGSGDFFSLASRRLDYIDQRQHVLARNIANADTPDFRPTDLSPFAALVDGAALSPVRTNALHLGGSQDSAASSITEKPSERAVDGNAVNVESQLTKVADDETSAALVGNLWKTTMGMYMTALGRSG
jgi:flagellar basal-body rod protein FlgB